MALTENLTWMNGSVIRAIPEAYTDQEITDPIVVIAVDSARERLAIWRAINDMYVPPVEFFIDAATGMDMMCVTSFRPGEENEYYLPLFEREEEEVPCGARSVAYNAFTVAGIVGAIVRAFSMGHPYPSQIMLDHKSWAITNAVNYASYLAKRQMAPAD